MSSPISILIQAYNEEANVAECIQSCASLTSTIIVTDSQSSDKTVSIAKSNGATVYSLPYFEYVEPLRILGIDKVNTDWVFVLDADERITSNLASEIKDAIRSNLTNYYIARKNMFGKKVWLRHGGWWPDYQPRLFRKDALIKWPKEIHSSPIFNGASGYLLHPLIHYSHGNFAQMAEKTIIFENIDSGLLLKAGYKAETITFFRKFLGELSRRLIWNKGFLDGKTGIIEGVYQAYSQTIKYLYLYEKENRPL